MALLFRLAFFVAAIVGAALLFVYATVVAMILIPLALLTLFLLRKKGVIMWVGSDLRPGGYPPRGRPPTLDHDPNDVTVDRGS